MPRPTSRPNLNQVTPGWAQNPVYKEDKKQAKPATTEPAKA